MEKILNKNRWKVSSLGFRVELHVRFCSELRKKRNELVLELIRILKEIRAKSAELRTLIILEHVLEQRVTIEKLRVEVFERSFAIRRVRSVWHQKKLWRCFKLILVDSVWIDELLTQFKGWAQRVSYLDPKSRELGE